MKQSHESSCKVCLWNVQVTAESLVKKYQKLRGTLITISSPSQLHACYSSWCLCFYPPISSTLYCIHKRKTVVPLNWIVLILHFNLLTCRFTGGVWNSFLPLRCLCYSASKEEKLVATTGMLMWPGGA